MASAGVYKGDRAAKLPRLFSQQMISSKRLRSLNSNTGYRSFLKTSASIVFSGSFAALLKASVTNTAAAHAKVVGITPEVITAAQMTIKVSYVTSFRLVFHVALAFGRVAMIAALCTRSVDLKRKTNRRAVRLENETAVLVDGEKVVK